MPELNSEVNIVEALRSKIEESDIKQYLKSTLGGYTKQSVLEYLNTLRKQQQAMAETFFHNQQALFDEKESVRKTNEALKTRLSQVESEFRELSNSLNLYKLDGEEILAEDIVALKRRVLELEDKLSKSDIEKSQLEEQIKHMQSLIDDSTLKLEQSKQEKLSIREILKAEQEKSKNQNTQILHLTGTIEEMNEEIKFLNALVSEGQLAALTQKVAELTEQLISQAEVLNSYNSESSLKSQAIETLTLENEFIKQRSMDLEKSIEELNSQNSRYQAANKALTDELESEYKKSITLIKERSSITIDKLAVSRKLDEANSKISMLELKLRNKSNCENEDAASEFVKTEDSENSELT